MSEKSWAQIRAELEMLPRQMCITPVAEVKEYVDEILKLQEQLQSAQAEVEQLRRELAEKDKVLRWYGEKSRYNFGKNGSVPILADGGKRARSILRKIGVKVE